MTETTARATAAVPADPYAAMAAPIRAAFTAAMAPYTNGEAAAPAGLTGILMEAVTAAEPTAELIGMLCQLLTTAAPDADTLSIMHRAMGAALGLGTGPGRSPLRTGGATAPRPTTGGTGVGTRPGSIGARILEVLAAHPGAQLTVTELARELGNGTGATGAAITGLLNRGELVMTGEHPRRYTTSAPAQATDTAPADSAADAPDAA
ncbi:hypothetical protein KDL01_09495 [Actinospica durhamensis]|uniref:Uncharacterized protein n=1 Tax=Actinospica durhamensis TaxID=1508375 RepID=A0A941EQY6_9ACTN|nr:hypothetical protein [Actinospica durhamensis]MBR7833499.1 hypothetical protein [Actinospica durhamensis]